MVDIMSQKHEPEKLQRELLEKLWEQTGLDTFEQFRNFPVFTPRYNLARFLVHYELFKEIYLLPGAIIDLGVFQGGSTFTWAKLCEIFCPTDVKKKVYGFDTFEGFPSLNKEDGTVSDIDDRKAGGYFGGSSIVKDLDLAQKAMNQDKHIRHIDRIEFVKGDIKKTVPKFAKTKGNEFRIALLNCDVDLYEPTSIALEHFVPYMVRGGIIILDEYATDVFGGESKAVDEYFMKHFGKKAQIRKFNWHSNPSGYIKVDW